MTKTNTTKELGRTGPIGVFDSGIGGLTVLREIASALPGEDTIYLGDTARVPYGSKSKETVVRYAREVAAFLTTHGVKLVVAACNTASAYAMEALNETLPVPVVGVIEPGAVRAVDSTKNSRVGVIGTEGTIRSGAYTEAIRKNDPAVVSLTKACPLFVPLAEEGLTTGEISELVAAHYLDALKKADIDTLVLGCTHYPLLKETISHVMGAGVTLIDSAEATATEVKCLLAEMGLENKTGEKEPRRRFFVTDSPARFVAIGKRFFGDGLEEAERVELSEVRA